MKKTWKLRVWTVRIALLVVLLGWWQIAADLSNTTRFFIGTPLDVSAIIYHWFASGEIYYHLGITLLETMLAFVLGAGMALVIGLWLALSAFWSAVTDPFIKAVNTMPRLILAPIFAVWFGLGIWSKVALGITIVFFIVFFNVFRGVREVDPVLLANVTHAGRQPHPACPPRLHPLGPELGILEPASLRRHGLRRRGPSANTWVVRRRRLFDPAGLSLHSTSTL